MSRRVRCAPAAAAVLLLAVFLLLFWRETPAAVGSVRDLSGQAFYKQNKVTPPQRQDDVQATPAAAGDIRAELLQLRNEFKKDERARAIQIARADNEHVSTLSFLIPPLPLKERKEAEARLDKIMAGSAEFALPEQQMKIRDEFRDFLDPGVSRVLSIDIRNSPGAQVEVYVSAAVNVEYGTDPDTGVPWTKMSSPVIQRGRQVEPMRARYGHFYTIADAPE